MSKELALQRVSKSAGWLGALVLLARFGLLWSQGWAQGRPLVVEGGTLIDGTARPPLRDSVIVIEGNRIAVWDTDRGIMTK